MALAVNRTGTIFKKCDRSNHKPETNKNCAAGTCQHTCEKADRCPHAWTLRYTLNGRQLAWRFATTAASRQPAVRAYLEEFAMTKRQFASQR